MRTYENTGLPAKYYVRHIIPSDAFDGLESWETSIRRKCEEGGTVMTAMAQPGNAAMTAVDPDQMVTGLILVYEEQFFAYLEV